MNFILAVYDLIINNLKKQNRNNNITFTAKFNHSRYSLTTLSSALQMIFFIDTAVLTTAATASFTTDSTWKKQFYLYINHHKQQPITLNQFLMAHNWHTHANSHTAV